MVRRSEGLVCLEEKRRQCLWDMGGLWLQSTVAMAEDTLDLLKISSSYVLVVRFHPEPA